MNSDKELEHTVPRVRVAAIIIEGDKILLVKHRKYGKTYWLLPGGGVDFGETIGETVVREVKEETNLDIELDKIVFLNDSLPPDNHRHVVNIYFTARVVGGELKREEGTLIEDVRFVPMAELPDLLFYPDIRPELLAAYRDGFPVAKYLGNVWD